MQDRALKDPPDAQFPPCHEAAMMISFGMTIGLRTDRASKLVRSKNWSDAQVQ